MPPTRQPVSWLVPHPRLSLLVAAAVSGAAAVAEHAEQAGCSSNCNDEEFTSALQVTFTVSRARAAKASSSRSLAAPPELTGSLQQFGTATEPEVLGSVPDAEYLAQLPSVQVSSKIQEAELPSVQVSSKIQSAQPLPEPPKELASAVPSVQPTANTGEESEMEQTMQAVTEAYWEVRHSLMSWLGESVGASHEQQHAMVSSSGPASVIVIFVFAVLGLICTCLSFQWFGHLFGAHPDKPDSGRLPRPGARPEAVQVRPRVARPHDPALTISSPTLPSRDIEPGAVPTPRQVSLSGASPAPPERRFFLCDPTLWAHLDAFFLIKAEQLYNVAETDATGDFDICNGGSKEPVFAASVRPFGRAPRELVLSLARARSQPIACVTPCMEFDGLCSKLEIRASDGSLFGQLSPTGPDEYGVFKASSKPLLTLQGDQENGRLVARLGSELVATATRDGDGEFLEVGVKPHIDPILVFLCVVGVVIFNPEEPESPSATPCMT